MRSPMHRLALPLGVAFLTLTACFSPAAPVPTRWFAPPLEPAPDVAPAPARPTLRIDRVTGAAHLGTAMVWRLSDVEIAMDDVHRWVDEPAALVARALDASLFGTGLFTSGGRDGARLQARVDAFEAVLGDAPRARVDIELLLEPGEGGPIRRARIEVERPLPGTAPEDVARALGAALAEVAARAASWCAPSDGG